MLRSGSALRLSSTEIETARRVGLDLGGVRTSADFATAIDRWIDALGEVRPDLLQRFVGELARAKGVTLPPRFTVVPGSGSPD